MKNKKVSVNKYAKKIDAELDLHGLTQGEAEEALKSFLNDSLVSGYALVRIITGKGLHSANGEGVLKNLTIGVLRRYCLEYSDAKINEGGGGALVVKLA